MNKGLWKAKVCVAILALLVAAGCNEENQKLSMWGMTAPDADFVGRVGVDVNDAEVGLVYKCFGGDEVDALGGYLFFHLTQEVGVTDTGPQSPIAGLLESLYARPYAGVEFAGPLHGEQRKISPNWILGTEFKNSPDSPYSLVLEGIAGDGAVTAADDYGLFFGARIKFK